MILFQRKWKDMYTLILPLLTQQYVLKFLLFITMRTTINCLFPLMQRLPYYRDSFVVVNPSSHVWNELSNEELDCKCEVCVVHASHAGTCASPEISNPSNIDSDRTETLSEISTSGVSTVAPSTVDSDVTVEPSSEVSESENRIEKQSFTVKRGHASTDSSSSGSSKSISILKRKKNHK